MEVLLLTNTFDGSSDIISGILKKRKIKFLRWNIDLWNKYEIYFDQKYFKITDPLNKSISSKNKLKILWRKPFTDLIHSNSFQKCNEDDIQYARNEIKMIISSIMAMTRDKVKHFIDPIDDQRLPKLKQLKIAKKYFDILPYEFSIINRKKKFKKAITKPLNNAQVGDKVLYASQINQDSLLRPYPWFVQEGLFGGRDITCVFIKNEVFFYYCDYKRSNKTVDWRVEINKKKQSKWHPLKHKKLNFLKKNVTKLMNEFRLNYGRLDFIEFKDKFFFLECNGNGQFGWLDVIENKKNFILHNKFVDAFLND